MGPIRRTISLISALALTGISGAALVYLIFFAPGFWYWMPVAAGVGAFFGLYWLWEDFISPDRRRL
jgi:hypothetical protein